MSRYSIRVHRDGDAPRELPCNSVYVDDGGDLHVNREQRSSDLLTVSRFQHGHWSSYELELADEAEAEELLATGAISINEFRRRLGLAVPDCCAESPVKAEALPEVGETVHVWRKSGKIADCCPMRVAGRCATDSGVALALAGPLPWSPEFEQLLTSVHDETRTEHASWHWPCEGDDQDAEPEPDAPAPISVTFNFDTPVLNERWLRESVDRALRQATSDTSWTLYRR